MCCLKKLKKIVITEIFLIFSLNNFFVLAKNEKIKTIFKKEEQINHKQIFQNSYKKNILNHDNFKNNEFIEKNKINKLLIQLNKSIIQPKTQLNRALMQSKIQSNRSIIQPKTTQLNRALMQSKKQLNQSIIQKLKCDLDYIKKTKEDNIKKSKKFYVAGFNLKIYKKGEGFILVYEHNITKAKIIFNLIKKNEMNDDKVVDSYLFKVFDPSDSGIVHICEHCFFNSSDIREIIDTQSGDTFFKATTDSFSAAIVISSRSNTKEFMECMLSYLKNPLALKDEEIFEVEKRRVRNEILDIQHKNKTTNLNKREYIPGGVPEEISKVTFENFKKFYRKHIHPSNMVVFKNIDCLDVKKIKDFLYTLNKEFLSYFVYKKIDFKYTFKDNSKFLKNVVNVEVDENYLKKNNLFKYLANLSFDLKDLNINPKQKDVLFFKPEEKLLNYLKEYIKKLGYFCIGNDNILELNALQNFLTINLAGNDELLFKKEILCESSKKICQTLKDVLKKLDDNKLKNQYLTIMNAVDMKKNGFIYFLNGMNYRTSYLYDLIKVSFLNYNEIFSNKIFDINKYNVILEDKETIFKNIKENLNVLDILKKQGPNYINLLEYNYNILPSEKLNKPNNSKGFFLYYLPFKLLLDDFTLFTLTTDVFRQYLDHMLNSKLGLTYKIFRSTGCYKDLTNYAVGNEYSKKDVIKYIYSNFDELINNLIIRGSFFQIYKKNFKIRIKKYLDELNKTKLRYQYFMLFIDDCLNYVKQGKFGMEINKFFDFFDKNCNIGLNLDFEYNDYFDFGLNNGNIIYKSLVFKDLEEKNYYKNIFFKFCNKYKNLDENITESFIKDFKENVYDQYYNLLKFSYEKLNEVYLKIDNITKDTLEKFMKKIILIDKEELDKFDKVVY